MAYELCPECRVNKVPRGYYVCEACEERLAREEFEPGPVPERRPFWKRGVSGPVIVREELDDPNRPTILHRIGTVLRYAIIAAMIGIAGLFVVGMINHPTHVGQVEIPDSVQHMQNRAHAIYQELLSAISNK